MPKTNADDLGAKEALSTPLGNRTIYRLSALESLGPVADLPYSIKVLLESCLRHCDGRIVTAEHVQYFTGVPAVVDLAAMRSAMVSAWAAIRRR